MKLYRKIYIVVLSIICILGLTGCGDIPAQAFSAIPGLFSQRMDQNIAIIEGLRTNGFITQESADSMKASMQNVADEMRMKLWKNGNSGGADQNTLKDLARAVIYWRCVDYPDKMKSYTNYTGNTTNEKKAAMNADREAWNSMFLTNSIYNAAASSPTYDPYTALWSGRSNKNTLSNNFPAPIFNNIGDTISPIKLIDMSQNDELMARLGYKIYVLKDNVDLAQVYAYVKNVNPSDPSTYSKMRNYFTTIKDSSNNDVTLIDTSNPDYQLIGYSKGSDSAYENLKVNTNVGHASYESSDTVYYSDYPEQPGNDMSLIVNGHLIMRMRLIEFNKDAYDLIVSRLGLSDETYMVLAGSGEGGAAYLMQYPVGYISGFNMDTSGTTKSYFPEIRLSHMAINIKTGRIIKQEQFSQAVTADGTGCLGSTPQLCSNIEQYLTVALNVPDSSSFVVMGTTGVGRKNNQDIWNLAFGDKGVVADVPRIVLMDYLEASYSPNIIEGEDLVVYGRKIRFDKDRLSGTLSTMSVPVAFYCEIDGVKPTDDSDARWLYLNDLCDYKAIGRGYNNIHMPYIARLPSVNNEGISDSSVIIEQSGKMIDNSNPKPDKLENLTELTVENIKCTLEFPGTNAESAATKYCIGEVDTIDLYNNDKPLFYAVTTCKSFGESGLVKWIADTSDTNSFSWWAKWLSNHGYEYAKKFAEQVISEYLHKNYTYELSEAGVVVINLETVNKIQHEMDIEDSQKTSALIRTVFKILGYLITSYGFLLLMCWAVDVNADLGFNLLEKASFKHMIAVSDASEIPKSSGESVKYIDFQGILVTALIMIAVGLLLIFLDIVEIVVILIKTFGNIAKSVGSSSRG